MGQAPQARHFPRRNRIISGLSRGVVIVEAAEGSGSLITANFALEQGREIFAVPGSPLDPRAKGTNRLIREGATLTESAEDVLAVLRPMLSQSFAEPGRGLPAVRRPDGPRRRPTGSAPKVEEALGPAPTDIDELIRQTGAPVEVILSLILELELAGRLARYPGNRVAWASFRPEDCMASISRARPRSWRQQPDGPAGHVRFSLSAINDLIVEYSRLSRGGRWTPSGRAESLRWLFESGEAAWRGCRAFQRGRIRHVPQP